MYEDVALFVTNERPGGIEKNLTQGLLVHLRKGITIVSFPALQHAKKIFGIGVGSNGVMANGSEEDVKKLQQIKGITDILCVGTGGSHAHVSTAHEFYSWGSGRYSQMGDGDSAMKKTPTKIDALRHERMAHIACSYSHTVALTERGKVYVWGSSASSQAALGLGESVAECKTPKLIEFLSNKQVRRVFCGRSTCFTYALTAHGDMYSWGRQLGLGDKKRRSIPVLSEKITRVAHLATGLSSVIAVNTEGLMFSWGSNNHGQLGYKNGSQDQVNPTKITFMRRKDIIKVSCTCSGTVLALSRSGRVYVWGFEGEIVERYFKDHIVKDIFCGSYHVLAKMHDDSLYGYTKGDYVRNELPGSDNRGSGLSLLNVKDYKHVVAGDQLTFVLTD